MLALPKKWVQEMGLGAGDSVAVEKQGDSSLIITPRVGKISSKADAILEVTSKNKTDSIIRRLIAVYLLGYSTMQVRAKEGALTAPVFEPIQKRRLGRERPRRGYWHTLGDDCRSSIAVQRRSPAGLLAG